MESHPSLRFRHPLSVGAGTVAVLALLVATPASAPGQEEGADRPEANPADVESPEAIVEAAFESLSQKNWKRFRSLHHPSFLWVRADNEGDDPSQMVSTLDEALQFFRKASADTTIHERPTDTVVRRDGQTAHVLTTVEARTDPGGELLGRYLDSFELWYDGSRWWIMSVL